MRKYLFLFLTVICAALVIGPVAAQYVGQGNGQIICQVYPQIGGGNATPCPNMTPYPSPFPNSTTAFATNSHNFMQTRNEEIAVADPNTAHTIFLTYSTGPTLNPQVGMRDMYSNTQTGPSAINVTGGGAGHTVTCGANNHDQPGGGDFGYGYVGFLFCANDTTNVCCSSTMGPGTSYRTGVIDVGNTVGGGVCNKDLTAGCSIHVVPGMHLSEVSCASWGPSGFFNELPAPGIAVLVQCSGQQFGPNTAFLMSGAYGVWTFYAVYDASQNLSHLYMDTSCDGSTITLYDVLSDTVSNTVGCNGLGQPTVGARTNLMGFVDFTGGTSGAGATATLTYPNWSGSCGTSYTLTGASGNGQTDAANFVAGLNAHAPTNTCYKAQPCNNSACPGSSSGCTSNLATPTPRTGCVLIECLKGCVPVDNSGTFSVATAGSPGSFNVDAQVAYNTKTAAGQNGQFQYGLGVQNWYGWWYHLIGNSNTQTWQSNNPGGNNVVDSFAVLACPVSDPATGKNNPVNGVWTCYDWTRGNDGFVMHYSPASDSNTATTNRYLNMGAGPACNALGGPADCSGVIPCYITNNGSPTTCYPYLPEIPTAAQPANWTTFDFDGDLDNAVLGVNNYPATSTDQGEFVTPNGDFWLVVTCGDPNNTVSHANTFSVCWREYPVGGLTGTNIIGTTGPVGGYVDENFSTSVNAYWNNLNIYVDESHNLMKVVVAANQAGNMSSRCSGTGTCVGVYTSQNLNSHSGSLATATFTFAQKSTAFTSSGNTPNITCQNSQDQFGLHTMLLCMPGTSTDGSGAIWFLDVNP